MMMKYLCNLLKPHIPINYNASDIFSFVQEIKQLSTHGKIMTLSDVESLFTNILLGEWIELAVNLHLSGKSWPYHDPTDLKTLYVLFQQQQQQHFISHSHYMVCKKCIK